MIKHYNAKKITFKNRDHKNPKVAKCDICFLKNKSSKLFYINGVKIKIFFFVVSLQKLKNANNLRLLLFSFSI